MFNDGGVYPQNTPICVETCLSKDIILYNKTPVHTKEEENGHTNELPENQKMRPMVNIRIKGRIMLIQLYRRHGGQEMRRKP
jgi:hypothetical protein